MDTDMVKTIIKTEVQTTLVVMRLVKLSCFFQVWPLPDGEYEISVKREAAALLTAAASTIDQRKMR